MKKGTQEKAKIRINISYEELGLIRTSLLEVALHSKITLKPSTNHSYKLYKKIGEIKGLVEKGYMLKVK